MTIVIYVQEDIPDLALTCPQVWLSGEKNSRLISPDRTMFNQFVYMMSSASRP